jgi:hypothetical protein
MNFGTARGALLALPQPVPHGRWVIPVGMGGLEAEIEVGHYRGRGTTRRACAGAIPRAAERVNETARRYTPAGFALFNPHFSNLLQQLFFSGSREIVTWRQVL